MEHSRIWICESGDCWEVWETAPHVLVARNFQGRPVCDACDARAKLGELEPA